jgi:glutamyl/glutaminyl-tRNA synthetase
VILGPDGGKLSKRKGAASVGDYRGLGYLPETLINFLSLLGWNPGGDEEYMEKARLIEVFTLEKINPKSAVFDEKKLEWLNGQYFLRRDVDYFLPLVKPLWVAAGVDGNAFPESYFRTAIALLKDRSKRLPDFVTYGMYFFREPKTYDEKTAKKYFGPGSDALLDALHAGISGLASFDLASLEALYKETAEKMGKKGGDLIHPTRLAISGIPFGPGLYELMVALGKDTVLRRLQAASAAIKAGQVKTAVTA